MPKSTMRLLGLALSSSFVLAGCMGSDTSGGGTVTQDPPVTTGGGGQSSANVGTAANSGGSYSVTTNGKTYTLGSANIFSNGQPAWLGSPTNASAYESANVLALGGSMVVNGNNELFAGISGTQVAAPTTGSATYTGLYSVQSATASQSSALNLSADFDNATITDLGSGLDVNGTISGGAISGTVAYQGTQADLFGGFYGTNEVAGAFIGNGIAGTIFGIQD